MHEYGGTEFILPRSTKIPEWFEHQSRGPSISFWFRNKCPSVALFVVCKSKRAKYEAYSTRNKCYNNEPISVKLIINGYKCKYCKLEIEQGQTYVFDLQLHDMGLTLALNNGGIFSTNKWFHVEVKYEGSMVNSLRIKSGIHVLTHKSSMEDIQFTDPL